VRLRFAARVQIPVLSTMKRRTLVVVVQVFIGKGAADFLQQGQHGGGIDPGPTSIELDSNGLAWNSRHGLGDLGGLLRLFVINEQTRGLLRRVYLVA